MKLYKFAISLSILSFLISSCGAVSLSVKPGVNFSRNSTITITHEEDVTGSIGELNHLLFEKGFNIISYSSAKKAIKYKDQIKGSDRENNEFEAEIYSIKELNSIYSLELNYTYYYDTFYYAFRTFSARVVDLNSGEIIMSANFRGDKSTKAVLRDFVNQLSLQVK